MQEKPIVKNNTEVNNNKPNVTPENRSELDNSSKIKKEVKELKTFGPK